MRGIVPTRKMAETKMALEFDRPPEIPAEWVEVVEKLHPITAVIVWSVLNHQVTPETIGLAKYSPDLQRFRSVAVVANGNPQALEAVTQQAYELLFDLFTDLLNHPRAAFLH